MLEAVFDGSGCCLRKHRSAMLTRLHCTVANDERAERGGIRRGATEGERGNGRDVKTAPARTRSAEQAAQRPQTPGRAEGALTMSHMHAFIELATD